MTVKILEVNDYFIDGEKANRIIMSPKDANYRGSLNVNGGDVFKPVTKLNVILRDEKGRFVSYKGLKKGLLILKSEIEKLPNCNWE